MIHQVVFQIWVIRMISTILEHPVHLFVPPFQHLFLVEASHALPFSHTFGLNTTFCHCVAASCAV